MPSIRWGGERFRGGPLAPLIWCNRRPAGSAPVRGPCAIGRRDAWIQAAPPARRAPCKKIRRWIVPWRHPSPPLVSSVPTRARTPPTCRGRPAMRPQLIAALLAAAAAPAAAQTVHGRVVERGTDNPVPAATVELRAGDMVRGRVQT